MNKDSCQGENDRRKHCEMVIALNERFIQFADRYEKDMQDRSSWRKKVDENLEAINQTIRDLKVPYRVGLWILVCGAGAAIIEVFRLIFDWIVRHFK